MNEAQSIRRTCVLPACKAHAKQKRNWDPQGAVRKKSEVAVHGVAARVDGHGDGGREKKKYGVHGGAR